MHRNTLLTLSCMIFMAMAAVFASDSACAAPAAAECKNDPIVPGPKIGGKHEVTGCANYYTGIAYQPYEYTRKIVHCIEGTIRATVFNVMSIIASEFGWVAGLLCTLVIIAYGARVVTGERELTKRTMTLALKLAFVGVFMNRLPDVVNWTYGTLDYFLTLVTGGVSPWVQIDTFFGKLFGFGPAIVLMNGLLGLVGAAAFSSSVGMLMFFTGIIAILHLLIFIFNMVYTYLLAYLAIGFLLVFAPVMIPLSLFFYTERYFKTWIDIIVTAILTPVLLFAFVYMFLGVFDVLIENIFGILGGNDFKAYWRNNQPIFGWLMPADPNVNEKLINIPKTTECAVDRTVRAPVQLSVNSFVQQASDAGVPKLATLDFGANDVNIVTELSLAFTTLWIFATLMKSMVQRIPTVAQSIGKTATGFGFGGSKVIDKMQESLGKTQSKLGGDVAADKTKFDKSIKLAEQIAGMVTRRDKGKK